MTREPNQGISRRKFIGHTTCAGFSLAGMLSTMGTLRLFNATLSAATLPDDDYRALVCLFFYGGNDANNVLVPRDDLGYSKYRTARGILSLPKNSLLPISIRNGDGRQFGLHPGLGALRPIFDDGKMAFLANVGTLVAPLTKAEYESGGAAVPPYLFSHNDQALQWQTSVPDSPRKVGWGGRLADLKQTLNQGSKISMNISLSGNNFFQVGNEVFQYHMTPGGSVGIHDFHSEWSPAVERAGALKDILGLSYGHMFESEYATITTRAIENDLFMKQTLESVPMYTDKFQRSVDEEGNLNYLASQLRMILRVIAARKKLGMKRQIFFCSLGGFDTHDDQLDIHDELMRIVGTSVADFFRATEDIGVSQNVTLFTASDFNRTFSSNGKGSDHAWGGSQFVVGGAVKGGRLYGRMPVLQSNGPDDTGTRGSWIPNTSVDEYSATLAKWFGVSRTDMPMVLPNIGRFASPDLGFLG